MALNYTKPEVEYDIMFSNCAPFAFHCKLVSMAKINLVDYKFGENPAIRIPQK